MGGPGLVSEVTAICKELMIPNAAIRDIDKETVQKAVKYNHLKYLEKELTGDKI